MLLITHVLSRNFFFFENFLKPIDVDRRAQMSVAAVSFLMWLGPLNKLEYETARARSRRSGSHVWNPTSGNESRIQFTSPRVCV